MFLLIRPMAELHSTHHSTHHTPHNPAVLRIAVPAPLRQHFDYYPPKRYDSANLAQLKPGTRILVPFGPQRLVGILLSIQPHSDHQSSALKHALDILDTEPALDDTIMPICLWAAEYYQAPIGEVLSNALPAALRKSQGELNATIDLWRPTHKGRLEPLKHLERAKKQHAALELLQQHEGGLHHRVLQGFGITTATLTALNKKKLVEKVNVTATHNVWHTTTLLSEPQLTLNTEQQQAVDAISDWDQFKAVLLDGVTGSGKTEVYLQLIAACLQAKRQALVLVPEIGLTPQTVNRFARRFNVPVLTLHSKMTDNQRLTAWRQARHSQGAIVIGTRSALFTPMPDLGLIIIDEEHDSSYRQQDGVRYSARDLAIYRAKLSNIPIMLGSATPALETLHNAQQGRYQHLRLTKRAGAARPPTLELVDIKQQHLENGLSEPVIQAIHDTLERREQVLLFLNRRGYAPVLMCHDCGWTAQCKHCDARMTYHQKSHHLHCHHCDAQSSIPRYCPNCKSTDVRALGQGTERLEENLQKLVNNHPVIRVDRDTTRRKDALKKHLEPVEKGQPCVLIGTQMLAKGHHFPKVTLVVIMDIDSGLFASDFRATEHMAQLVQQVAGRAGRADLPGKVLLQTHHSDNPLLQTLIQQGYHGFADNLLQERKLFELPPFSHITLLRAEASKAATPQIFLQQIAEHFAPDLPDDMDLWGPVPTLMQRKAGQHRFQLVVKSPSRPQLQHHIARLLHLAEQHPYAKKLKWLVEVDPLYLE